jgi:hypothetical protein
MDSVTKNFARYVIVAILVLAVVGVFAFLMNKTQAEEGTIDMTIGKARVKMGIKNDLQSIDALLKRIFRDDTKQASLALLADVHGLYSVRDLKIVDAIAGLSPAESVSPGLRELARKQVGPFRNELKQVRISFPTNPNFGDDDAVVCSGSDFFGRNIYLTDSQEERHAVVTGNNTRPCQPLRNGESNENIQITVATARKLFGDRPLQKFENGLAGPG